MKSKKMEKNPAWKGNNVGYRGLHKWVRENKPKSFFCEKCGKITEKLDIANISGQYKRDISDFRWLCRKCHLEEDKIIKKSIIRLKAFRKSLKPRKCKFCNKEFNPTNNQHIFCSKKCNNQLKKELNNGKPKNEGNN